jgi:hypothetical protein
MPVARFCYDRRAGGSMKQPVERRLAAILAADVAGYSRLMGVDEEGTHERLTAHFRELVDPKIKEHRGRTVKNTGDGLLAEFASVVGAVRCAAQVQRGMIDREPEVPSEQRIRFRIAINLGDVIVEEHDIFGDGVNSRSPEYLSMLRDARLDPRVPLLRYEHAPDQYKGLHHPCSHFHIGHHADNRWALNRLLTPLAFTLLILKLYYGSVWRDLGLDEADKCGNSFETALIEEKTNCRPIRDALFSALEARSFFFG